MILFSVALFAAITGTEGRLVALWIYKDRYYTARSVVF